VLMVYSPKCSIGLKRVLGVLLCGCGWRVLRVEGPYSHGRCYQCHDETSLQPRQERVANRQSRSMIESNMARLQVTLELMKMEKMRHPML